MIPLFRVDDKLEAENMLDAIFQKSSPSDFHELHVSWTPRLVTEKLLGSLQSIINHWATSSESGRRMNVNDFFTSRDVPEIRSFVGPAVSARTYIMGHLLSYGVLAADAAS